jgi:esterase
MKLYAETYSAGSPSSPGAQHLIVLHGLFGCCENWRSLAKQWADTYTVHCVDLRNHGKSPHHADMQYPTLATDIEAYISEHGLGAVFILGHSLGGKVAMQFALDFSHRVIKLIVADIAPINYPPLHAVVLAGLSALNLATIETRTDADRALAQYIESSETRQFLLKNLRREPAGGYAWKMNLTAIADNYPHLAAFPENEGKTYTGPALFIKGGHSDYLAPEQRENIEKYFPHARLSVVPAAGHWLHADNPAIFSTLVKRFLGD